MRHPISMQQRASTGERRQMLAARMLGTDEAAIASANARGNGSAWRALSVTQSGNLLDAISDQSELGAPVMEHPSIYPDQRVSDVCLARRRWMSRSPVGGRGGSGLLQKPSSNLLRLLRGALLVERLSRFLFLLLLLIHSLTHAIRSYIRWSDEYASEFEAASLNRLITRWHRVRRDHCR